MLEQNGPAIPVDDHSLDLNVVGRRGIQFTLMEQVHKVDLLFVHGTSFLYRSYISAKYVSMEGKEYTPSTKSANPYL